MALSGLMMCQPLLVTGFEKEEQWSGAVFKLPLEEKNRRTEVGTPAYLLHEATVSIDFMDGLVLGRQEGHQETLYPTTLLSSSFPLSLSHCLFLIKGVGKGAIEMCSWTQGGVPETNTSASLTAGRGLGWNRRPFLSF